MNEIVRRSWSAEEKDLLTALWFAWGSVILISAKLGRSTSAIQTQASRMGLPGRDQGDNEGARKKWEDDERAELVETVDEYRREHLKIPIFDLAQDYGRSVDSVADAIRNLWEEEEGFIKALQLPEYNAEDPLKGIGKLRKRPCLCCQKPFFSTGPGHRLCTTCRSEVSSMG